MDAKPETEHRSSGLGAKR